MSVLNLLYWFLYVDNSLFKFREINININWVLILQLTLHYTTLHYITNPIQFIENTRKLNNDKAELNRQEGKYEHGKSI